MSDWLGSLILCLFMSIAFIVLGILGACGVFTPVVPAVNMLLMFGGGYGIGISVAIIIDEYTDYKKNKK